jgi:hypothetical protein
MVMLSDLYRFRLTDDRSATGRLMDVAVDVAAGDYTPVTRLMVR